MDGLLATLYALGHVTRNDWSRPRPTQGKQDAAIWKCQNLQRNVWHLNASEHSVRMAIHFFVNFVVFEWLYPKTSLINTKLEDFVNLSVLFINSCLSHNLQTRT